MNDPHSPANRSIDPRCAALRAVVHEVADGDGLTPSEALAAADHLAVCPACRALVATQRACRAACARAGGAERAPESLRERIASAIDEESLSSPR